MIFGTILIFLYASLLSFIGSIQLGTVNLFIIKTRISSSKRNTQLAIIGGILPEFIYCTLAVISGKVIFENQYLRLGFSITMIIVLCFIGLQLLKNLNKPIEVAKKTEDSQLYFLRAFILGILNPQLIFFWTFIYFSLPEQLNKLTSSLLSKIAFVLGSGAGAFLLLLTYSYFAGKNKEKLSFFLQKRTVNQVLAVLFLLFALVELIKLFN